MAKTKEKEVKVEPVAITVREDFIQILFEGMKPLEFHRPKVSKEAEKDNPKVQAFDEMLKLVNDGEWQSVLDALRPSNNLGDIISDDEVVEGLVVEKGRIKYQGYTLNNSLTKEIIGMLADANRKRDKASDLSGIKPLIALLGRTIQNSDNRVVDELYDFVKRNDVMVDKKGMLQTVYVSVDKDGKNGNHKLKKEWDMPRNMVNSSTALSVYSQGRISKPSGESKVMRVVVDPANVVEVSNSSLVVCALKVKDQVQDDSWED